MRISATPITAYLRRAARVNPAQFDFCMREPGTVISCWCVGRLTCQNAKCCCVRFRGRPGQRLAFPPGWCATHVVVGEE